MFCPECGSNLPDGSAFCTNCGKQLTQPEQPVYQAPVIAEPEQPVYQAPVIPAPEQPVYQAPVIPEPAYQSHYEQPAYRPQPQNHYPQPTIDPEAMSKGEFIKQCGDKKVKTTALVTTLTMLLALILIGVSIFSMLTISMFRIPVIYNGLQIINDLGGEDIDVDELEVELQKIIRDARTEAMLYGGEMSASEKKSFNDLMDAFDKFAQNPSLLAGRTCMAELEEVSKTLTDWGYALNSVGNGAFAAAGKGIEIIIGILIGCFFLPLLFTLLGGLRKSTGLTVAALIFTVIAQLTWSGWIWAAVTGAVLLVQCILCRSITKAQMAYRWSFRN